MHLQQTCSNNSSRLLIFPALNPNRASQVTTEVKISKMVDDAKEETYQVRLHICQLLFIKFILFNGHFCSLTFNNKMLEYKSKSFRKQASQWDLVHKKYWLLTAVIISYLLTFFHYYSSIICSVISYQIYIQIYTYVPTLRQRRNCSSSGIRNRRALPFAPSPRAVRPTL